MAVLFSATELKKKNSVVNYMYCAITCVEFSNCSPPTLDMSNHTVYITTSVCDVVRQHRIYMVCIVVAHSPSCTPDITHIIIEIKAFVNVK